MFDNLKCRLGYHKPAQYHQTFKHKSRTTNICKANGIDTLGDLCKLHKTDWLKFRNSGKKSLIELDDLLHDNGLDWAEWR